MARKRNTSPRKELALSFTVPLAGYRRSMYFNRFSVEAVDAQLLLDFALLDASGFLRDGYSCSISRADLDRTRENNLKYLEGVGIADPGKLSSWRPPTERRQVDAVLVFHFSRINDSAEIAISTFATRPLIERSNKSSESQQDPIAGDHLMLLMCDLHVQLHLIGCLYE